MHSLYKLWETVEDRGVWRPAVHGVTKSPWIHKESDITTTITTVPSLTQSKLAPPS